MFGGAAVDDDAGLLVVCGRCYDAHHDGEQNER